MFLFGRILPLCALFVVVRAEGSATETVYHFLIGVFLAVGMIAVIWVIVKSGVMDKVRCCRITPGYRDPSCDSERKLFVFGNDEPDADQTTSVEGYWGGEMPRSRTNGPRNDCA